MRRCQGNAKLLTTWWPGRTERGRSGGVGVLEEGKGGWAEEKQSWDKI